MLNSVLSNFRIEFGDEFFPEELTAPFSKYLYLKNNPLKTLEGYLYETIQNWDIPGIDFQELVTNIGNVNSRRDDFHETSAKRSYPGTDNINNIIGDSALSITMKNSILNWMYCYGILRSYYNRKRETDQFMIRIIIMDSADIPMIQIRLSDCYLSGLPGLSFAYNTQFNESKTFDCKFTFNGFNVDFLIPGFDINDRTF